MKIANSEALAMEATRVQHLLFNQESPVSLNTLADLYEAKYGTDRRPIVNWKKLLHKAECEGLIQFIEKTSRRSSGGYVAIR